LGTAGVRRRGICGALVGLAMLHGSNLLPEFAATTLRVMTDDDVAWIILVCGFMGSLIARNTERS